MKNIIPLIIEKTSKTPGVIFDPSNNRFEMFGRSLPENVVKAYEPVLLWLDQNMGKIQDNVVFNFKVDYLNSASAKMISLILTKLEEFYKLGTSIEVHWHYYADDDDILNEGEIYAKLKSVPIKLIEIEE